MLVLSGKSGCIGKMSFSVSNDQTDNIFEWYMTRLGVKRGHQDATCDNEIGLCPFI